MAGSNICNELRTAIDRKYRAQKYWPNISGLITAVNPDGSVCSWSIHKLQETVVFKGVELQVLILKKRVYTPTGAIAYEKDIYAEQWV